MVRLFGSPFLKELKVRGCVRDRRVILGNHLVDLLCSGPDDWNLVRRMNVEKYQTDNYPIGLKFGFSKPAVGGRLMLAINGHPTSEVQ